MNVMSVYYKDALTIKTKYTEAYEGYTVGRESSLIVSDQ